MVQQDGKSRVRLRNILEVSPAQFGIAEETSDEDALTVLAGLVAQGLRARLVTAGLLSGALDVDLVEVADAPVAFLGTLDSPFPIIPTTASEITDVATAAEAVVTRIANLPIEELMQGAIDLMGSLETLASDGDLRAAPEELRAILSDMRSVIGSDGVQNSPAALQSTLAGIERVVADIGSIVQNAAQADLVGAIATTLATTNGFVADLDETASELPGILAEFETLAAKANALELEALLDQTTATLDRVDALITSPDLVALPGNVILALDEVRALVTDVRSGGAVENLNAALQATSNAARSVEMSVQDLPDLTQRAVALVTQLQTATENLPRITAEIEALAVKANSVEVNGLIDQATNTLASIETLIASPGAQDLPGSLNGALGQIDLLLGDIRDGGAVQNVNAALASASQAALAIEAAAQGLPDLSQQATRLVDTLNSVAEVYGERGRFIANTSATLRDIQQAADAVAGLARTIQRNPGALLRGR